MVETRSRAFTRAVHVSGLGCTGPKYIGGVQMPHLEAVPSYVTHFEVNAGLTVAQDIGLLARGTYVNAIVNHLALTSGTVAVSLIDPAGVADDIDIVAALDLDTAARDATGAFFGPIAQDRIVRATVSSGTASETAILSLEIGVLRPDWN
jgi:hypothetical protein